MITVKNRRHKHPPPSPVFSSYVQWFLVNTQVLFITCAKLLFKLMTQTLILLNALRVTLSDHISISSIFTFVRLSLIAHGLYSPEGLHTKSASCYTLTDDELETCITYSDAPPAPDEPPDPKWLSTNSNANSNDLTLSNSTSTSTSNDPDTTVFDSLASPSEAIFSTTPPMEDATTAPSEAAPKPSVSPTLPQPKSASKKKKGNANSSSSPKSRSSSTDKPALPESSSSVPQTLKNSTTAKNLKLTKQPRPAVSSTQDKVSPKKRDLSPAGPTTLTAGFSVPPPTAPKDFDKYAKKQQNLAKHKKKSSEIVSGPTSPKKSKSKSLDDNFEKTNESGFKAIGKKAKRKKNSSASAKLPNQLPVSPASESKTHDFSGPSRFENDHDLMPNDTGNLSEIIDAALLDLSKLSKEEDFEGPLTQPRSCDSPVSDGFYSGTDHASSYTSGLNSFSTQPWSMKPFQTSFSAQQTFAPSYHQPFALQYDARDYPFVKGPLDADSFGRFPGSGPMHYSDFSLATPPMSPSISDISVGSSKKQSARVTNSNLTWSVPDHMSNF